MMGKYSKDSEPFMQRWHFLTKEKDGISDENPTSVGMDECTAENSS